MKKYPFKFLDAYTKEDKGIFFGRKEETEDLYRLIFQTNLLLVYGASGTGKTSLIRCGLANRFKPSQWLDLYIRRGADINQSLLDTVVKNTPQVQPLVTQEDEGNDWFESLMEQEKEVEKAEEETPTFTSDNPTAQALQQLYLSTFTPIYLIFDQFEEIYTLGTPAEQRQLNQTIEELVQLPLPLKIIIIMREEYLANLYSLEKAVPQLRDKKLRIEPMSFPRVEQVILNATAYNPESNINLEQGKEEAIARAIIEKIREGGVNIKLPYLQVFMDRLYEAATGDAVSRSREALFTIGLVGQLGDIGDVLSEFIERQSQRIFRKLAKEYEGLPSDVVWQILSPFATVDGTKVPIKSEELPILEQSLKLPNTSQVGGLIKEAISELENSRILRYRSEENTYEVAHDTLALKIAEKRSEEEKAYLKARRIVTEGFATYQDTNTLLSREQLAFIKPYEERLEKEVEAGQRSFISDSRKKRRRQQLWLWSGVAAAFLVAIWVIVTIYGEQQKTEQQRQETQKALDNFLTEQAKGEKTQLELLLQQAEQISKGSNNCPPEHMMEEIDRLYSNHNADTALQLQYDETMKKLEHCE